MSFLLNYADKRGELGNDVFDDLSDIVVATIRVDSGDETLTIIYRNGEHSVASMFSAWAGYYDGEYDIIRDGSWVVDREAWEKRKSSYDFLYGDC